MITVETINNTPVKVTWSHTKKILRSARFNETINEAYGRDHLGNRWLAEAKVAFNEVMEIIDGTQVFISERGFTA